MRRFFIGLVLILSGFVTSQASGAIVLAYSVDGTAPIDSVSQDIRVGLGETVRVSVYLLESAGDTRMSSQALLSAGFGTNYNTGLGRITNAGNNPALSFFPDVRFDTNGEVRVAAGAPNPISGISTGGAKNFFIGFFEFQTTAAGKTDFTFVDPSPGASADVVLADAAFTFPSLDDEVFADTTPFSITVTAIPEPSSLAFLAGLCGFGLARRRRR